MNYKVLELGLEDRVIEMYAKGMGSKMIAGIFQKEGIEISHMSIERWVKNLKDWTLRLMSAEQKVQSDYAKKFLNSLSLIFNEMQELQEKAKSWSGDRENYIKLKKIIKDYVELNAKRLGDLQSGFSMIKTDKVEIANVNVAVKNEIENLIMEKGKLNEDSTAIIIDTPEFVDMYKKREAKLAADIGGK